MIELRPYQWDIADFVIDHPRCLLTVPMGLGKTVSTVTALRAVELTEQPWPALVVAPKRVALTTWPDEVQKWAHLRGLTVSVVIGSPARRKKALEAKADIYCVNYDNLEWIVERASPWPFRTVVADECSKLKGYRGRAGSKRAAALSKVVHQSARYIGLTGTPAPNGLIDLWGQQWFVDGGAALGRTFTAFRDRWFTGHRVGQDMFAVEYRPNQGAREQIEELMGPTTFTLRVEDHFDIAAPIVCNRYVTLPEDARKAYDEMEEDLYTEISGEAVEAVNVAVRSIKLLQIANGFLFKPDKTFVPVHDEKLDCLEEIVEEAAGMPVLVAYHFKPDLARLQARFRHARVLDADPRTIKQWNRGEIPLLLAHPASCGHGLNLQDGGNILVYYAHWWNLEERLQILERIGPVRQAQAGHPRPVYVYNILAAGTVDDDVLVRMSGKADVQQAFADGLRRRQQKVTA